MNYQTNGVVGLSANIENIKNDIYDELNNRWQGSLDAYGRMYKLAKGNSWTPNWYKGNNEYSQLLMDDRKCIMYFEVGDNDKSEDGLVFVSNCKLVFMINLSKAFASNSIRSDSEIERDVIEILRNNSYERFQVTGIERNLTKVFGGMTKDVFENFNDQPYFTFAVEIDIDYYLTDKC